MTFVPSTIVPPAGMLGGGILPWPCHLKREGLLIKIVSISRSWEVSVELCEHKWHQLSAEIERPCQKEKTF